MKRVLMVGAGSCQVSGIKRLKKMGYEVIVADYHHNSPGKELADFKVLADAFDVDAIEKAACELKADAIMTMGTDQPVFVVSKVAETCGLRAFLSSETAYAVTNKMRMKRLFKENDIPTAPFVFLDAPEKARIGVDFEGPYVLKPVDSQGQRGIVLVETRQEIEASYDFVMQYTREKTILVEQYYPNEEVTVNGWVHQGQVQIIAVTDRVTFSADIRLGVCTAHEYPSKYSDLYALKFKQMTEKICAAFAIEEGPIYFQFLVGADGIYINEIACRLGGAYEDISTPYTTGIDLLDLNIEGVSNPTGYEPKVTDLFTKQILGGNPYSTQLFFCKSGEIYDMTTARELESKPYIVAFGYNFKVGDFIPETENASQRAGYAIITGKDEAELALNIEAFYQEMRIMDSDKNNLVIGQIRNRKCNYTV